MLKLKHDKLLSFLLQFCFQISLAPLQNGEMSSDAAGALAAALAAQEAQINAAANASENMALEEQEVRPARHCRPATSSFTV